MNDERTLLFRAVLPAELNSIVTSGCFQNILGIEIKYFATTRIGALEFAQLAMIAFRDGPFTIVGTSIPSMLIAPDCRVVVDLGIVTVTVPTNLLYALEPPTILEVV